jgi:predicted Fe-S protein YdhL (DUF1289 family)
MEKKRQQQVVNPCIQICSIDWESGLCMGCSRTADEVNNWPQMTAEEQLKVIKELKDR